MALSRVVEGRGIDFYRLAEKHDLEGIVAKRKDSIYIQDKRTKDWIKIKNLKDDDFVVCGYIHKDNHMTSIILGQYQDGELIYKGHVTLGVGGKPDVYKRQLVWWINIIRLTTAILARSLPHGMPVRRYLRPIPPLIGRRRWMRRRRRSSRCV